MLMNGRSYLIPVLKVNKLIITSGIEVSEGSEFDCVVLYIDVVNNCVEVTLNPQLVTAVRKRLDRNKSDSANQVSPEK